MRHLLVAILLLAGAARAQDAEPDDSEEAESESAQPAEVAPGIHYSSDISEEELRQRWEEDLESLGSISVGFADQGRLINALQMPEGDAWVRQRPNLSWGAQETIEALATAFRALHERFPDSAPARLSQISARDGGYLKPHRSHQSGRDADIGFFYKNDAVPRAGAPRERLIDTEQNWALLRELILQTDVQVILVDRKIQRVLRAQALLAGEDRAWVDRIFSGARGAIVQHARRHRDHFHVRFFAPRSQELGRRIQPLLALRPEQNLVAHKVKRGQTLGHIALAYDTTVAAIRKANHMGGSFLRIGHQLLIPLRKPCTHCPLPPPVVVRPRCLPNEPAMTVVSLSLAGGLPETVAAPAPNREQ
jgi:murein endopeptidase